MELLFLFLLIAISLFMFLSRKFEAAEETRISILKRKQAEQKAIEQILEEQKQEHEKQNKYHIKIGAASPIRYYLFPLSCFNSEQSRDLYEEIVLNNLWINEPFHSTFVSIIKYIEENDDCIKSNKSQEFIIKIKSSNEKGIAYKVHSLRELIFKTMMDTYNCVNINYCKNDMQTILIATLLFNIHKIKVTQVFANKDATSKEKNIAIIKAFLCNYADPSNVLYVINMIDEKNDQFNFINNFFEKAKHFAEEFPYVEKENIEPRHTENTQIETKPKKILLQISDFNVQQTVHKLFFHPF